MGLRFDLTPDLRFKLRVIIICLCWYAVSSASSITNKVVLQTYPYPVTLALSNLLFVPVFSIPFLRMWEFKVVKLTSYQYSKYLTPISAVKASMPLFSVFLSRVILKETQSKQVYFSLLPIVAGVVVASATELSFSFFGMFSALLSTFTYSLLNIWVKKLLKESDMHPLRLLAMNSQLAAIIVFPFWLLNDAFRMTRIFGSNDTITPSPDLWLLCLLSMSGLLSFLQNVCAFSLIHELTALSYAVCNATKRITVIGSSLLTLHNPVTGANVFGMMLSILGVFCYNQAKQADKVESQSLPLTRSHTVLSDATIVALDSGENNDVMYWASTNRSALNGSRLDDFSYSDAYVEKYDKMDDISKEQYNRRHATFFTTLEGFILLQKTVITFHFVIIILCAYLFLYIDVVPSSSMRAVLIQENK